MYSRPAKARHVWRRRSTSITPSWAPSEPWTTPHGKVSSPSSTYDFRNERWIEPIRLTGPKAELIDLTFEAGASLRGRLGVGRLGFSDQRAVRAATPSSAEALRLYVEGLEKLRELDYPAARIALSAALEIDPEYALAHTALSRIWSTVGDDRRALSHAVRAYELASGLLPSDHLRIEGRHFEATAEWPRAIHAFDRLWRLAPDDVDYGLRLAEAQIMSGRGEDALATITELRDRSEPARRDLRVDLTVASAAKLISDYSLQLTAANSAVEKATAKHARVQAAHAWRSLGEAHYQLQQWERARQALEQARLLFERTGDQRSIAEILSWLADIRYSQGDPSAAVDLYHEARRIHHETGNRKGLLETENSFGYQLYLQGDLNAARTMLKDAVDIGEEIGDRASEANSLDSLVEVVFRLGALDTAEQLALRQRTIYRELGNQLGLVWSHYHLGRIALAAGDVRKARNLHDRALSIIDRTDDRYWMALILDGLARVLLAGDDPESARRMSDDARSIRRGGEETLAASQVTSALVLLELNRPAEAAALVSRPIDVFRAKARPNDEAAAVVVLARALMAQGKLNEARSALAASQRRAQTSQNPAIRLQSAIAGAELLAAEGEHKEAAARLAAIASEAHGLGLIMLELEAILAWGKAEAADDIAAGLKRLRALATKAGDLHCELIARKATEALSDIS